jgi:nucleotide-binding universal stress UspA family protein
LLNELLVPLDGSKTAEISIAYATALAQIAKSQVHLIKVTEPGSTPSQFEDENYLEKVKGHIQAQAETRSQNLIAKSLTGKPADEILNYADAANIDLIIVSSHGKSADSKWFLGSVADKLLRAAKQSILLIKKPLSVSPINQTKIFNKILLPLDGSKTGESAIPTMEEMAYLTGAELILFRVVAQSSLQRDSFLGFTDEVLEELIEQADIGNQDRKESAEKYLAEVEISFKQKGLKVSSIVVFGQPADQIIDYSQANNVDLIATASHGRSGITRWVFGSVTDKILHAGDTPVLVVKAKIA